MYANNTMQCDAETVKFFSFINHPTKIEQKAKIEDLSNYLNTDYALTSFKGKKLLQYTRYIGQKKYPLSMIKDEITSLISSDLKYEIQQVHIDQLNDDGEKFTVFTIEINEENIDYSLLLDQEYELSNKLDLDKKNIILRLV